MPESKNKLSIAIIKEGENIDIITAQYNPKEISIDKSVSWNVEGDNVNDNPALTFTKGGSRTASFELFFDYMEDPNGNMQDTVDLLTSLTLIAAAEKPEDRHPPLVVVIFGTRDKITGVVESLGVKYTMFNNVGDPVRATCSLKIKETNAAKGAKPK